MNESTPSEIIVNSKFSDTKSAPKFSIKKAQDERLEKCASEIKTLHHELVTMARDSMQRAVDIGQRLAFAKDELPHGKYEDWVLANFDFTPRTATRYMRVFWFSNQSQVSDLSLSAVYKLLTPPKEKPSATPPVTEPSFEEIEKKERLKEERRLQKAALNHERFASLTKLSPEEIEAIAAEKKRERETLSPTSATSEEPPRIKTADEEKAELGRTPESEAAVAAFPAAGAPSDGLKYADQAIELIEKIQPNDTQRKQAIAKVLYFVNSLFCDMD
jgi:hypothetical protein